MRNGKPQSGRKLCIPAVQEYHNSDTMVLKVNLEPIKGRPVVALKKLIELGFKRGYYDRTLINSIIDFGFDKGYWNDADVLSEPFRYFAKDMNHRKSKEARLRELEGGD